MFFFRAKKVKLWESGRFFTDPTRFLLQIIMDSGQIIATSNEECHHLKMDMSFSNHQFSIAMLVFRRYFPPIITHQSAFFRNHPDDGWK